MNPPSPEEWIDNLSVWQVGDIGVGIYDGIVNNVDCPVVVIDEEQLHVAITRNAENIWHYDRTTGEFETVVRGSAQWSSSIIEAAGISLEAGPGIALENLSRGDVAFKLLPTTP